ncbi:MAG TPA: cell wall hydrolase [Clostridiales bacterium]|nr:cell wall hydrolase [Clostridiales bacterium]
MRTRRVITPNIFFVAIIFSTYLLSSHFFNFYNKNYDETIIITDNKLIEQEFHNEIEEPSVISFSYETETYNLNHDSIKLSSIEENILFSVDDSVLQDQDTLDDEDIVIDEGKYSDLGVSIAKKYVNIRKEPNASSEIIGELYRDSVGTILDKDGDWYHINSGGIKGYVSSEYIASGLSDNKILNNYSFKKIIVKFNALNVRKEPNLDSEQVSSIYKSESYKVYNINEDWVQIHLPQTNSTGYVSIDYVDIVTDFNYAVKYEPPIEIKSIKENTTTKEKTSKSNTKTTKESQREEFDSSTDELKLLACLIYSEASGQSYEGKLAVANVVLNRVKSKKYPNNINKVIYQKGQFSVVSMGILEKHLSNYNNFKSSAQKDCIKAAKEALSGTNNINNRLYFNAYKPAVRAGYDKKSTSIKIDGQLFW